MDTVPLSTSEAQPSLSFLELDQPNFEHDLQDGSTLRFTPPDTEVIETLLSSYPTSHDTLLTLIQSFSSSITELQATNENLTRRMNLFEILSSNGILANAVLGRFNILSEENERLYERVSQSDAVLNEEIQAKLAYDDALQDAHKLIQAQEDELERLTDLCKELQDAGSSSHVRHASTNGHHRQRTSDNRSHGDEGSSHSKSRNSHAYDAQSTEKEEKDSLGEMQGPAIISKTGERSKGTSRDKEMDRRSSKGPSRDKETDRRSSEKESETHRRRDKEKYGSSRHSHSSLEGRDSISTKGQETRRRHSGRSKSPKRSQDIPTERHSRRRSHSPSSSRARAHRTVQDPAKDPPEPKQPTAKTSQDVSLIVLPDVSANKTIIKQTNLYGRLGLPLSPASGSAKGGGMSIMGRGTSSGKRA